MESFRVEVKAEGEGKEGMGKIGEGHSQQVVRMF